MDGDDLAIERSLAPGIAPANGFQLGSLCCGSRNGTVYASIVRTCDDYARSLCRCSYSGNNQPETTPIARAAGSLSPRDRYGADCLCALGYGVDSSEVFRNPSLMVE